MQSSGFPAYPQLNVQVIAGVGQPGKSPPFGKMPWSRWLSHWVSNQLGLPVRGHVADYFDQGTGLQVGVVYAGHGHFRHRLSPTKWENPFVVGRDGTHVDTVFKYIMGWDRMQLDGALDELTSKIIVCDCPTNSFCHVDVIIAKWFDRSHRPRRSRRTVPPLEPSCWQGSGLSAQFPKLSVSQLLWQPSGVSFPCWISKVLSGLCWKI